MKTMRQKRAPLIPEEYRRLALSFPGVIESSHHDHPDFRVGGKIFATIYKGNGVLMLKPEQQTELLKLHPGVFSPAAGAWGRKGSTTVRLDAATEALVRRGLRTALQNKVKL
jgi:hypothetical protein